MEHTAGLIMYAMEMDVRWGDCDPGGIAYNAKYFDWFSDGRIKLFKKIGLPYHQTFHKQGIEVVVVEANCRYKHSLLPEEEITLEVYLTKLTRSRLEFKYRIIKKNNGALAAEGMTTHAYVDKQGKPIDIKKRYPLIWERLQQCSL